MQGAHAQNDSLTSLRILDLCTGSGCISLLLKSLLSSFPGHVQIHGWDISPKAVALANENLQHSIKQKLLPAKADKDVHFSIVDVLDQGLPLSDMIKTESHPELVGRDVDIIISNPPYISSRAFKVETTRSVRNWEPKLALVPEKRSYMGHFHSRKSLKRLQGRDIFYRRLLSLHSHLFKSKILIMEVGDKAQAVRVVQMAFQLTGKQNRIEIWKDFPSTESTEMLKVVHWITVRGNGNYRAVVLYRESKLVSQASRPGPPAKSRLLAETPPSQ